MPIGNQTLGPDSLGSTNELSNVLSVLKTQVGAIPVESNFLVQLNIPWDVIEVVVKDYEPINWKDQANWLSQIYGSINGNNFCFATEITDPGESLNSVKVGPSNGDKVYGNLLSAPVISGRRDMGTLRIGFIETNGSIADYVLRPWLIAVSTYGLFAKSDKSVQNVKTNVIVTHINSFAANNNLPRKKIIYKNCVPIAIGESSYKYSENTTARIVPTTWTFDSYSIESGGDSDKPRT